jgi:membrane-bound lytic murein transglycosylase
VNQTTDQSKRGWKHPLFFRGEYIMKNNLKKKGLYFLLFIFVVHFAKAHKAVGLGKTTASQEYPLRLLRLAQAPQFPYAINTDPEALYNAASLALARLNTFSHPFGLELQRFTGTTEESLKKTLEFLMQTIEEDRVQKFKSSRLQDPNFLAQNFSWVAWMPDGHRAHSERNKLPKSITQMSKTEILLTNYAVFRVDGSYTRTSKYNYALYNLRNEALAPKYSRTEIMAGALNKHGTCVTPLVWVTKAGLEQALMQGSVIVSMPDGKVRNFHIHLHNNKPYHAHLDVDAQQRYWFFREVQETSTLPLYHKFRVTQAANALFAGNVKAFGMGTIVCLKYFNPVVKKHELALGVLADTGGAFINNTYQLDFFAGVFNSHTDFKKHISTLSDTASAYFLIKKAS